MGKKKNKHRKPKRINRDPDPFLDFYEEDYEEMELSPHAFARELLADEVEFEPEERRFDFDYDRWRYDLIERSSHRERMRQRELKRGILNGIPIKRLPLEPEGPSSTLP